MKNILVGALLIGSVQLLFGQKTDTLLITPGSDYLESNQLTSYTGQYDLFRWKDEKETPIGSLEDNFIITEKQHERQALRVCKIKFGTNEILDSGLCLLKGLKPIYHRSIQTQKTMNLQFADNQVNGAIHIKDGDKKELVLYQTSVPLFDSYYEDIIAKSITLKKGVIFKFPEYIYERGGTVWSTGQVTEKENTPSGTLWTVQFYELDAAKKIIRTTLYKVDGKTRDIEYREYLTGNGRIVMRKRKA